MENKGKEVIIISGSSGLIGSALIKKLAGRYTLIGLDNKGYPYPPPEADCITIDITSDHDVEKVFASIKKDYGNRITSFIHLAAYYSFTEKSSPLYDTITVEGTQRLLRYLHDFETAQFLFTSSMLVYAPVKKGDKIMEDAPLNPVWGYPLSKVKTEKILQEERGDIPVVNMRVAGVYDDEGNSIPITHHIQRIYEKQVTAHFFPGDPSHGSTFIHLDDLIAAIINAIEKRDVLKSWHTFNIGENKTFSYKEIQHLISREIHGKEWKIITIPKALAKAGAFFQNIFGNRFIKPWMIDIADDHYDMDNSKAREILDWQPMHSLDKTIPAMIEKLKNNPDAWYEKNKLKKIKALKFVA